MKKQLLTYFLILATSIVSAQLYEIGVFVGGSNYIGDLGPTYYINPNAMAYGGVVKYNYSSRINFRGTLTYTNLRMDDTKSNNDFRKNRGLIRRNKIVEAVAGVEFNFFKYNIYRVGYSSTPYIFAEAGVVNYRAYTDLDGSNLTSARVTRPVFPFGVGYKTRIMENMSLGIETSIRYTLKDDIDGNFHELNDKNFNFGNPDSDDWYVFTGITFTYVFGRAACNCDDRFF